MKTPWLTRQIPAIAAFIPVVGLSAPLYWGGTSGQNWTSATWSTDDQAPYSTPWVSGSEVIFNLPNSLITGATTQVSGILANENVTVTPGGTLGTGGTNATIEVASGKILNFGNQTISTALGTGFIKTGAGTLNLAGSAYSGGFTLNEGSVGIGGVNALGAGGALHLNGGNLQTSSGTTARDLSGKFAGGIHIGGDFSVSGAGALKFNNTVHIEGGTPTITNSSSASFTLAGNIVGDSGNGLNFAGSGHTILNGTNSFDGSTNINSGIVTFGKAASIPSAGVVAVANGATLGLTLGTGAFSVFDITSAFNGNLPNVNLSPNSRIGIHVPSGIAGFNSSTYGTMGLVKLGAGTLFLDGQWLAHSGGIHVPSISGENSVLECSGSFSSFIGSWHIGQALNSGASGTTTVNFLQGTEVSIETDHTIEVGGFSGTGNGAHVLNVEGNVFNAGTLRIGLNGAVVVKSFGTWTQDAPISIIARQGGNSSLTIQANTIFTHSSDEAISLSGSSMGLGRALINIQGGIMETNKGFLGTPGPGSLAYARLTLSNGGTLRVLEDVADLTTQVQVALDGIGGTIETYGDTTLSGIVTAPGSTATGITGTGSLEKTGNGSLTLTGNNTYLGSTLVSSGSLFVNGSIVNSTVIVQSGATLGGDGGTIGNGGDQLFIEEGGILAPGNSAGTLNINGSAYVAGTYSYEFTGGGGGSATDLLEVGGTIYLSNSTLSLSNLGSYLAGDKFTLISYNTLVGEFTGLADDSMFSFGGGMWKINYDDLQAGLNGGTGSRFVTLTAIPEISIPAMFLGGAVMLFRRRVR
jgi:autotransporter-associated beta strand protein